MYWYNNMYNTYMRLRAAAQRSVVFGLLALGFVITAAVAVPGQAAAHTEAATEQACIAVGGSWDSGAGTCSPPAGSPDLNNVLTTFVDIFSAVIAIVAVIMIIWGGFRYITAGGDTGKLTSARNTIIYAVVGLAIVALAQAIVGFVLETATD